MRAALLSAVLVTALAVPAFAQAPMSRQGDHGSWADHQGVAWGNHDHSKAWADRAERRGNIHTWGAGAFFRFKHGNDEVDVRCPPHLALQACVAGATTLLKSLQQMRPAAPPMPPQK